jgi:hypothetical protein
MSRLAALAAAAAMIAPLVGAWPAAAADTSLLTWPGKAGAAATITGSAGPPAPVALSRQFFAGSTDDMAAAPPPLMPRPVPGSPAITNASTINTASNRARQNEILTADSASDGPVAGAENPN